MRHGDLTILVTALLGIRHLIFQLDTARPRLNHPPCQQIGRLFITKASINISDNRHDMCLMIINRRQSCRNITASGARLVQIFEQMTQFTRISLAQESINLFN